MEPVSLPKLNEIRLAIWKLRFQEAYICNNIGVVLLEYIQTKLSGFVCVEHTCTELQYKNKDKQLLFRLRSCAADKAEISLEVYNISSGVENVVLEKTWTSSTFFGSTMEFADEIVSSVQDITQILC